MKLQIYDIDDGTEEEYFGRGAEKAIEITLSEKNLVAMLAKLYWGSARTMYNSVVYVDGELSNKYILKLRSEPNTEHYDDSDRKEARGIAGPNDPRTEVLANQIRKVLMGKGIE